ncbi:MAG: hypothetical protein Q9227_004684 [Pyrenula ochraceoflavens]
MTWATSRSKLVSWRTLALLLLIVNAKSIPLSWHLRLLYHWLSNIRWRKPTISAPDSSRSIATSVKKEYPLFQSTSYVTRTPLFECDYNGHKSNSTYFSDLDFSRTQRVVSIISPAIPHLLRQLEREGYHGRFNVILGSVHTSFRKEIKPYERYEVRSKFITWDRKWMVIGSSFVRKHKGGKEICAASISKYVMKKGRYTIPVDRMLQWAGILPEKPIEHRTPPEESAVLVPESGEKEKSSSGTENNTPSSNEGITASSAILNEGLERVLSQTSAQLKDAQASESKTQAFSEWTWEAIEAERVRGMKLAESWLKLDTDLLEEFDQAA